MDYNQDPYSLNEHSTIVGSILSGIGAGAVVALLVLIEMSVSFGQNHATNAEIYKAIALNSTLWGLGFAIVFAVVGYSVHSLVCWLSRASLEATTAVSQVLSGFSGAVLGGGLWLWQLIIVSPVDGIARTAELVALIAITEVLIIGAWLGLSSLLTIRKTAVGRSISLRLALTAALASLFPWAYLLLTMLIRR